MPITTSRNGFGRLFLGLVWLLSACSLNLPAGQATPTNTASSQGGNTFESTTSPTSESSGPITLTIWLPPAFDPAGGNLAATMLQNRLNEFSEQHPQARIETRVKAEEGTGGLLDSLLSYQQAAPLALPDLTLLPNSLLQIAAQNEILHPLDALSSELDSEDWYPFARLMAVREGQDLGLPFAADALVMAYRHTAVQQAPATWQQLNAGRRPLGFSAADPMAVFTLAELLSLEGRNETIRLDSSISPETLTAVFEFLARGRDRGVFPFWLTQYQTAEQSWQAFIEGSTPMVVVWTSQVFLDPPPDVSASPIPTQDGQPYTLMKGWLWTVTTPHEERATLAANLAEFLSTPEFIAQWSAAAGLLPPRPSSLAAWSPDEKQALASQIVSEAGSLPDQSFLDLWGPALSEAIVPLLKQELTPAQAVENVLAAVANPQ